MSWLLEPWQYDFMLTALAISVLISGAAGALSCFLVLKGWSLMGDAISHAVLPGIVLAYMTGLPLILGAFVAGLFCAFATGFVAENSRVKPDTVMGVVFSGMFGLGVVMYTAIQTEVHLDHILFGNMLGVLWADVAQTGLLAGVALLALFVFRRDLMVIAFDEQHARAIGLRVQALHYGLLIVISLIVVGALSAVGLILAIGLLIAPGALAFQLTERFGTMFALSIGVAILSAIGGLYLSFYIGSDPASSIILILTVLFVAAFLAAPKHGLLIRKLGLRRTGRDPG